MIRNSREYNNARLELSKWSLLKRRTARLARDLSLEETELAAIFDARIEKISSDMSAYRALQSSRYSDDFELLRQIPGIGESLIRARINLGWSQSEFAKRLTVTPQQVHRYEISAYGTASLSRMIQIAGVMHESIDSENARFSENF